MPGFGRNIHRTFIGADKIRPKLTGLGCTLDGKGAWFLPLGFPRGEAGRLDGSSEPARLTDEGQRYLKVSDFPVEW